ncbi:MAG: secretin and TonB N-terminal domain-containing protein, partial [Candidatus Obscuribacterales bacterium]|nr:secretin and TonB N-terminal domain-containing protein [Candidatus Obscuribacterales bacterium]
MTRQQKKYFLVLVSALVSVLVPALSVSSQTNTTDPDGTPQTTAQGPSNSSLVFQPDNNQQDNQADQIDPGKILSDLPEDTLDKLAQLTPSLKPKVQGKQLPTVTGTVQIRQPFKLFAEANQQKVIHQLSFRETPVKEVISELARRGNLNIIIDKSVTGKVTGELRDVTLDEAMDSVLASAGLRSRILNNNTLIVGTLQAMVQLGLNRPIARAFKLSYAHPFDVAAILQSSIFNLGYKPNFLTNIDRGTPQDEAGEKHGDDLTLKLESKQSYQLDDRERVLPGLKQSLQEGVGYNNAAINPGTQQIRTMKEENGQYPVPTNDGGCVVIPDSKGKQVFVVGTQEDVLLAEQAIHLLDRRPKQVHIQASLIELSNQGVRQLGATFNVQGQGLSASVMGNAAAPLLSFLPGLGSQASSQQNPNIPQIPFSGTNVTGNAAPFTGIVGTVLPLVAQTATIAGVT